MFYFQFPNKCTPLIVQQKLLKTKGVFPSSSMNRFEVLFEKPLPSMDKFYTDLTNKHIIKEEYVFALKVLDTFNCKYFNKISRNVSSSRLPVAL